MNKVMLIGNVGQDPVVRYYDADQAVAQIRLATTERGYTLQNGTTVPSNMYTRATSFMWKVAFAIALMTTNRANVFTSPR